MNFEDATQLQNHKANFCSGTVMHPFKTDKSYQTQKLNQTRASAHDSQLISTSIMNSTLPDLLQQNEDEYQSLRRRVLDRETGHQLSTINERSFTQQLNSTVVNPYSDSFAKLQESMARTVRTALFGQDAELEHILKEVRERPIKEKEFLKDRDVIERELALQRKKNDSQKVKELESISTERDILQERYDQFIQQAQALINSKTGAGGKENLERVIQLKRIKESMEIDRARIMGAVFQIQTGDLGYTRKNQSGLMAAQNILSSSQAALPPPAPETYNPRPQTNNNSNANQSYLQYWNIPDNQMQIEQPIVYDPQQVQYDASQIDRNHESANKLASEIKMWMQGMDPALQKHAEQHGTSIFDTMFSDNKEDYKMMSAEEKRIINLIAQEADAKRALQRLPPGTDIYYQKAAQVAQIAQMRGDLEKVVQEQKYYKIRENYERINKDDDDGERRTKIRRRLMNQMESWRSERKYDASEGLVVHWDWCLNVPKRYEKCKLTWGIFLKGQTLHRPMSVEDHICVSDGFRVNYCMFGEHNFVYDIVANKDVILVIELQCFYKDENFRRKLDVYGWSIHELFDLNQNLIRGRFKLPFYASSTNPSQLIAADKPLRSVSNTMLFIRISFPFDYEYGKEEPLNPAAMTQEYYLTGIHSKTLIRPDYEHVKVPVRKRGYNPLAFDELFNKKAEIKEVEEEEFVEVEEAKGDEWQLRQLGDNRKGIYVNIHEILNYFTQSKSKVRCFLTDVQRGVIKDEKGVPCSFETDPYEGQEGNVKGGKQKQNDLIMSGPFVFVEEEYQFFVDLETYAHNNRAWDDLYLIFQVFDEVEEAKPEEEKNEEDNQEESKEESMNQSKTSLNVKQTQIKSQGKRWYAFKLFENNIMKIGRYAEFIFDPPIKKPPFDPLEARITQSQIDFSINFFDYNMKNIDDQMDRFKMLRMLKRKQRGKGQAPKKERKRPEKDLKVIYDWQKLPISDRPFIENHNRLYKDRAFEKGFGIDFYIDQARFLPDNVTLCKIIVQLKNTNLENVFPPKSVMPDIKTTTFSPFFNYKQEIRSPHFDPTMLAFITILTVDNTNKEVRIAGYTAINLFLSKRTKMQPTNPIETDIILMDGAYQLPIFCQHPTLIKPFNMERMMKLDRLPAATLLVRTVLAPMSDDGLKPMSMNDYAQKEWEVKGIWQKMPPYGTGYYNTDLCPIRDTEKDLYNIRVQRNDPPQTEIVARLLSYENMTKQMTIAETLMWLDQKLVRDAYTDIIELVYFAKYKPEVGFKISIDGFHNVPDTSNPFVAIYSLNPPGRLYLDLGFDTRDVIACTSYNWDSPAQSPQFNEGYFKFKDVPFQKNTHIILDIRKIIFSERGNKAKIEKVGWTILPLFTQNGFIKSGNYQVPIFQGQVPVELVRELQRGDPWEIIEEKQKIKKGGLKFLEPMSAVIRLLDGHREGHFQTPFDHSRMIWSLIPKNLLSSYIYNEGIEAKLKSAKRLLTLAPNKEKLNEFNEKITKTLYDSIGLKQDGNEGGIVEKK